ncbi:MAG: hypothetical protein Fur0041_12950 [Bacteroidia bacterium]
MKKNFLLLCLMLGVQVLRAQQFTDTLVTSNAVLSSAYFDESPAEMTAYMQVSDSFPQGACTHVIVLSSSGQRLQRPVPVSRMQVALQPNPVNTSALLSVRFPEEELNITVINALGQVVWTQQFQDIAATEWVLPLQTEQWQSGMYLLQVRGAANCKNVTMLKE